MSIGEKLKFWVIHKFGTLAHGARAFKMKPPSMYSYYKNESKPGSGILQTALRYGCDLNWLLDDKRGIEILTEPENNYSIKTMNKSSKELFENTTKFLKNETFMKAVNNRDIVIQSMKNIVKVLEMHYNTLLLLTSDNSPEIGELKISIEQIKREVEAILAFDKSIS